MTAKWICTGLAVCAALVWACVVPTARAAPDDLKLEVQLIWGTNDSKSPDPKHKPVEPEILKRLKELPLKWSHYFEVNRKPLVAGRAGSTRITLSDKCEIEVRHLGQSTIEVTQFGRGKQTLKRQQPLPKGEVLVLGGNAPDSTCWLVTLKRIE